MEFGLDKCAKASFKRGKKVLAKGIPLNDNQVMQDLDQAETYNYLGMEDEEMVQHHKMKVKIKKEYREKNYTSAQVRTECMEQDSRHQYPSSPSNPLQLWSH